MLSKNKTFLVASYLRLSREDGDKTVSESIANQKTMIAEFIKQHDDLELVDEYTDDGYSGTNFERPGFQRMMEDVEKKKINCIIVKDLSRLGRNYIETGRYLETIFPLKGIRFIAILDHYDNFENASDSDQIIVPFKNLINDAYCRDISTKVRSNFAVKRREGQFIGSFASYGYKKDPNNRNHLIIDPYAADIVKMIFKYRIDGISPARIADKLNESGVLPPSEYKKLNGLNFSCGYRCGENPSWKTVTVNRILENEIYTGTMVQGINRKVNYKIKQSRPVPKEDWIRVPDTHEAIVSRDIFECAQNIRKLDTRTAPDKDSVYIFSGLIYCGDCGQNMVKKKVKVSGHVYNYYHCNTYKNNNGCSSHLISDDKLQKIVLNAIRDQVALLVKVENIVKQISNIPKNHFAIKMIDNQMMVLNDEMEKYKELKSNLYRDKVDEIISEEEFYEINQRFSTKYREAKTKYEEFADKKQNLLEKEIELPGWLEDFKKYGNITKLERKIVVTLIERITVYSKKEIEITFRYADEIQELVNIAHIENGDIKSEVSKKCVM